MNAPVSLLCDEDAHTHTRADATLRLLLTALWLLDNREHDFGVSNTRTLALNGNDHTAVADLHDYIVVAREDGSRDCSSIPCASARDSFQGKREL